MNDLGVAVIVLNYNNFDDTYRCLKSLELISSPRIYPILVDNASTDGSGERLQETFPSVLFISSVENKGYTGGNNLGIKEALKRGFRYIHVLNNDVEVCNVRYLADLVDVMERSPEIGILGPRVYVGERGRVQNTVFPFPTLRGIIMFSIKRRLHFEEKVIFAGQVPTLVEVVDGVCLLLRAEMLEDVGLFNEAYFMYCEVQELSYRAKAGGWNTAYLDIESIIHYQKGDRDTSFDVRYTLVRVNQVRFLRDNGFFLQALFTGLLFMGSTLLKGLFARGISLGQAIALCRELARVFFTPSKSRGTGHAEVS